MKKKAAFILAMAVLTTLALPLKEASSVVILSVGGSSKGGTLQVNIMNGTAIAGTYVAGKNNLSFAQYLEVKFSCAIDGYQALIISTDNSVLGANPRYTGTGSGSGLILESSPATNAALHWVVFDSPVSGGYTFVPGTDPNTEPIKTANQFFVADKKESPFPAGYASFVYDLTNYAAKLADAPTASRQTTDGTVYVYLGANLKFMPAGTYRTNRLKVELVTIKPDQSVEMHYSQTFTVTATR